MKKTTERLSSTERKRTILDAAERLANEKGWLGIRRDSVAEEAGVADGAVNFHFGTFTDLRNELVNHCVMSGNYTLVGQAIVAGNATATKLSSDIKQRAMIALSESI